MVTKVTELVFDLKFTWKKKCRYLQEVALSVLNLIKYMGAWLLTYNLEQLLKSNPPPIGDFCRGLFIYEVLPPKNQL